MEKKDYPADPRPEHTSEKVKHLAGEHYPENIECKGEHLPADAYAVTYLPTEGYRLYLPKTGEDENREMPDEATALLCCAIRLQNDLAFLREQVDWMESQASRQP